MGFRGQWIEFLTVPYIIFSLGRAIIRRWIHFLGGVPHTFIHGFLAGVRHSRALDTLFWGVPHTSIRRLLGPGGGVPGGSGGVRNRVFLGNFGKFRVFLAILPSPGGGVRGVKNRVFPRFPGGDPRIEKNRKNEGSFEHEIPGLGGSPGFREFREIRVFSGNSGNSGKFGEFWVFLGNSGKFGEFWEIRGILGNSGNSGFSGGPGGVRGVGNRVFRHFWGGTPELKKRHF